jgi:hypothetical protein
MPSDDGGSFDEDDWREKMRDEEVFCLFCGGTPPIQANG